MARRRMKSAKRTHKRTRSPHPRKGTPQKGLLLGMDLGPFETAIDRMEAQASRAYKEARKHWDQSDLLMKSARKNLEGVLRLVQKSPLMRQTKNLAAAKTNQILSTFNIPTKRDVKNLSHRVSRLEKRLHHLAR